MVMTNRQRLSKAAHVFVLYYALPHTELVAKASAASGVPAYVLAAELAAIDGTPRGLDIPPELKAYLAEDGE